MAAEANKGRAIGRAKRNAAYVEETHAFHDKNRVKTDKPFGVGSETSEYQAPKKDRSVLAQKVYEFQFYTDFDKV